MSQNQLHFKLIYFCMFAGLGILGPYVPVFFERLNFSKPQIGILLMIPNIASFIFAPLWSLLCDWLDLRSEMILFTLIVSQILTFYMYFVESFYSMIFIVLVSSVIKSPLTSLLDTVVMQSLIDKTRYGDIRLYGAISFALCSLGGGIILSSSDKSETSSVQPFLYIFSFNAISGILTGIVILSVIIVLRKTKADEKIGTIVKECDFEELELKKARIENNIEDLEDRDAPQLPAEVEKTSAFRCADTIWIFFTVVFFSGLCSGVIDGFLFIRLKQLGGSGLVMGVARLTMCLAEVPCFKLSGFLQTKLGTWRLLAITQLAYLIRFCYYSVLTVPWAVLPCEVLHGFTYAVMWSTVCSYADEIAQGGRNHSTIQAAVHSIHWGLGAGLGVLLGGFIYDSLGAVFLFQAGAIISLISVILSLLPVFLHKTRSISDVDVIAGDQNIVIQPPDKLPIEQGKKTINLRERISAVITALRGYHDTVYSSLNNTDSENVTK